MVLKHVSVAGDKAVYIRSSLNLAVAGASCTKMPFLSLLILLYPFFAQLFGLQLLVNYIYLKSEGMLLLFRNFPFFITMKLFLVFRT